MTSDEQSIRDLFQTWLRASADNQLDVVLGLMSDDMIFLRQGQAPICGKQAFADAFNAGAGKFKIDAVSNMQEIQIEGKLAYCLSHLSVTMTPITIGTPTMRMAGNILSVLRKQIDGNWVIHRDANMLAPQT
ncbi:MAG: SgcJ/EcaC family oxidoreductase [Burkholderiales bacterium]